MHMHMRYTLPRLPAILDSLPILAFVEGFEGLGYLLGHEEKLGELWGCEVLELGDGAKTAD